MSSLGSFGNNLMLLFSVNIFFKGHLPLTPVGLALFRIMNRTFSCSSRVSTMSKDGTAVFEQIADQEIVLQVLILGQASLWGIFCQAGTSERNVVRVYKVKTR